MLYGGIEGGGTKFVCAVGNEAGDILAEIRFPTVAPGTTLNQAITFFKKTDVLKTESLGAIGIGTFGPVDLDPDSPDYGSITCTPKAGWAHTDIVGPVQDAFPNIPVGFDTDVNAAALGEQRWGAAQDWDTFIYMTIGTGIGGGALVDGRLLHGLIHPEMGHILLPLHPDDPLARGVCPFHGNCLEGLASGPALEARWGVPGEELPADHPAWDIQAYYLAHALVDFMATLSPQGFVLGGSVMHQTQLFPMIRAQGRALANGYFVHPALDDLARYIVPPGLGDQAGVLGSIALAIAAHEEHTS
jgi:fructokinase